MVALGYPGPKISLKEDDVPTLFPVVEAMLMPLIRRTWTTKVHLGSKRAVVIIFYSIKYRAMTVISDYCIVNTTEPRAYCF